MATFFLVIIYLAFISLGLPDSLLGAAWPVMHPEMGAPLEAAGLIAMVIAIGTIISSFSSGILLKHFATEKITFVSCLLTAGALLGYSYSPSILWLCLFSVPLGLGAGAVDTVLNNYVANHYKAHHMSWLHCFWGIGATIGPIIMSMFISRRNSWRGGYFTVSMIQFVLVTILFFTLPLWKRADKINNNPDNCEGLYQTGKPQSPEEMGVTAPEQTAAEIQEAVVPDTITAETARPKVKPLHIKGVKLAVISVLFYCGAEVTMGLWGSSFLVNVKKLPIATAASWVSMYYAGITIGRFITGFITMKVSNKLLIRYGQITALTGTVLLFLPLPVIWSLLGFILVGLGCAPIYPCILHETPVRFGKENSHMLMGYQMGFAYVGITFLPPLFGLLAAKTSIIIFPFFILLNIVVMLISSEKTNIFLKKKQLL